MRFDKKLILNQWMLSLFGIGTLPPDPNNPQAPHTIKNPTGTNPPVKPFRKLADVFQNTAGKIDDDNQHHHYLTILKMKIDDGTFVSKIPINKLEEYDHNIVEHTNKINDRRKEEHPIEWKYYQWLTLLFVEIYLDRFFSDRETLMKDLSNFLEEFRKRHIVYYTGLRNILPRGTERNNVDSTLRYLKRQPKANSTENSFPKLILSDLKKICIQSATGSGKTLLMHINYKQFVHYAQENDVTRTFLITTNERLSKQHVKELRKSGVFSTRDYQNLNPVYSWKNAVDVIEITKFGDEDGDKTIAVRNFGNSNLLLVDEGHRGAGGNKWFSYREQLCEDGFSFEYSATFRQGIVGTPYEDVYACSILFDYSYRWFYEDGYGKDYRVYNLQKGSMFREAYLTGCLLKFYQQMKMWSAHPLVVKEFQIEKPLWLFVGRTANTDDADILNILNFLARFLNDPVTFTAHIQTVLSVQGGFQQLFAKQFEHIQNLTPQVIYNEIIHFVFRAENGGNLVVRRLQAKSGEITLSVGEADPFGLINIGDSTTFMNHLQTREHQDQIVIENDDITEPMFGLINTPNSPINILIGANKFTEGWDCWRVSTMGLMNVGKKEGAKIIQLFGRGVRLKGYGWSLKRSVKNRTQILKKRKRDIPSYISELETISVFGIKADYMQQFRDYLKEEGILTNENFITESAPIQHSFNDAQLSKLKMIDIEDDEDFDLNQYGFLPRFGDLPNYLCRPKKVINRIPSMEVITGEKGNDHDEQSDWVELTLHPKHYFLIDESALYRELERDCIKKKMYCLTINIKEFRTLLLSTQWYVIKAPKTYLDISSKKDLDNIQRIAFELLKLYCKSLFKYYSNLIVKSKLDVKPLTSSRHENLLQGDYTVSVPSGPNPVQTRQTLQNHLQQQTDWPNYFKIVTFNKHLYTPLLQIASSHDVSIEPNLIIESEMTFVHDLKYWYQNNAQFFQEHGVDIYLVRNRSRGRGLGFFEAGNFHPDFIMWIVKDDVQKICFIDPHGLIHEDPNSTKLQFYKTVKEIEERLNDDTVLLDSYILSPTPHQNLNVTSWGTEEVLMKGHVLFMDNTKYIETLLKQLVVNW
jgi:hypothetical protein